MSKPSPLSLAAAWETFSRDVLQHNALTAPLEAQKTRKIFYSGALALSTFEEVVSRPGVPAPVGEATLMNLRAELEFFKGEDLEPSPQKPNLVLAKP